MESLGMFLTPGFSNTFCSRTPLFEGRSIKHATQDEVSRRVGELLRSYDYAASMDFGAFDGSCTSEIRNLVENDIIVSLFSKLLGTENDKGLLYQAVHDRIKQKGQCLRQERFESCDKRHDQGKRRSGNKHIKFYNKFSAVPREHQHDADQAGLQGNRSEKDDVGRADQREAC